METLDCGVCGRLKGVGWGGGGGVKLEGGLFFFAFKIDQTHGDDKDHTT